MPPPPGLNHFSNLFASYSDWLLQLSLLDIINSCFKDVWLSIWCFSWSAPCNLSFIIFSASYIFNKHTYTQTEVWLSQIIPWTIEKSRLPGLNDILLTSYLANNGCHVNIDFPFLSLDVVAFTEIRIEIYCSRNHTISHITEGSNTHSLIIRTHSRIRRLSFVKLYRPRL